ncbi:MAG TPA: DUF5856 family protein [Bacteroidia bacterium]|jgi:DNA-binding ferritin-like protein|nr:DUF5856 family protein [Bacteroidia bacterium]
MKEYASICGFLVWMQTSIKLTHWSQKGIGSEARHEALGDLYQTLDGKIDQLVESLQSYAGILELRVPEAATKAKDHAETLKFLEAIRSQLKTFKVNIAQMSEIANLYEEIILAVSQTIYKIKILS